MSLLRDVAGQLLKMFLGEGWLAFGILAVVLATFLLMRYAAASAISGGTFLFAGCVLALLTSVAAAVRASRLR